MRICGIDPGLSGGAFVYNTQTHEFQSYALERIDSRINILALAQFMANQSVQMVYIEKILLTGKEGGQSAMTIGANYGRIMAVIELCNIVHWEVPPKTWQRALSLKTGSRAIVKQSAQDLAVERFTMMPFLKGKSKKLHDGLTDAACITLYGVQQVTESIWSDTKTTSTKSTQSSAPATGTSAKKSSTSKTRKSKSSAPSKSKSQSLKGKSKASSSKSTPSSARSKTAGRS